MQAEALVKSIKKETINERKKEIGNFFHQKKECERRIGSQIPRKKK